MQRPSNKHNMQTHFDKWAICKVERDILRIKTSEYYKFNTWVVPCTSEAVCIAHGSTEFESGVIDNHILLSAYTYQQKFIDLLYVYADEINTHLIVPMYYEGLGENKNKDKLDCGISINGKCKEGEEYIDTMRREIAEEVGIMVGKSVLKSNSKTKLDENFGVFYARDCRPYDSKDEIKFSDEKDCPRKKIFSYVIGSLEECKDLVHRSRELYPSTEFNYGVAIIPVSSVLNPTYSSKIVHRY
jgi:hypothetical protein